MLTLHSIIEEHLESLVNHDSFLFLRDAPSPDGAADTKHLIEVESEAGVFETLRPIVVVAVFGRFSGEILDKVASIGTQNTTHPHITVKCSHAMRVRSFLRASYAARTFVAFKDSGRGQLVSGRGSLRRVLESFPSLNFHAVFTLVFE